MQSTASQSSLTFIHQSKTIYCHAEIEYRCYNAVAIMPNAENLNQTLIGLSSNLENRKHLSVSYAPQSPEWEDSKETANRYRLRSSKIWDFTNR